MLRKKGRWGKPEIYGIPWSTSKTEKSKMQPYLVPRDGTLWILNLMGFTLGMKKMKRSIRHVLTTRNEILVARVKPVASGELDSAGTGCLEHTNCTKCNRLLLEAHKLNVSKWNTKWKPHASWCSFSKLTFANLCGFPSFRPAWRDTNAAIRWTIAITPEQRSS